MTAAKSTALLLIDVFNDFDFTGGEALLANALPAARRLAKLRAHLKAGGIPVIYVNDGENPGEPIARCHRPHSRGGEIAGLLAPDPDDPFVTKTKSSGFFRTALEELLREAGTEELILGGFAGNICVLHTAIDASMRGFRLVALSDGMASESEEENKAALAHMALYLDARIDAVDSLLQT